MDPYVGATERPPCKKGDVWAEVVVVFGNKRDDRGLHLISPFTRAVKVNEIHEFILTDETGAKPATIVNRIGYLCFAEIKKGGAIMFGDKVMVEGQIIGEICGFDETHMPNHINIILRTDERKTGFELNIAVGQQMLITDRY